MQPPKGYGQPPAPAQQQRSYRNPMNDPNSPKYWARGTSQPSQSPSFPGVGQTGRGYGQQFQMGTAQTLNPSQGRSWSSENEVLGRGGQAVSQGSFGGQVPGVYGQTRASSPFSGYMGGQLNSPTGVTGWQSQVQPMQQSIQQMYPQVDPVELARRKMLMQQQQMGGQYGVGSQWTQGGSLGQVPASMAQNMTPQNVTQPFQATNPWQQRVPQNFNQGTMYDSFTRRW